MTGTAAMSVPLPALSRFHRLLRTEQAVSAAINAGFSLAFFAGVFGFADRVLELGAPDRFALDFLPQGAMVALMAALVPSLVLSAKLRRQGLLGAGQGPARGEIARTVLLAVLGGLACSAGLIALAYALVPGGVPVWPALAFKIAYGALLGALVTRGALVALYASRIAGAQ